jgi:peptide/nickel transport system ATP-binding protein
VDAVLRDPGHAYTRALLASTPRLDRPAEALAPVPPELVARLHEEARIYDLANQANYQ